MASSISSIVAMPSLTSHSASRQTASSSRSATKASISVRTCSGACRSIRRSRSRARSTPATSCSPPTISTSGSRYTGLNGCATTKRSGRRMSAWSTDGSRPDVDEAMSASGGACCLDLREQPALQLDVLRHALLDEVGAAHRLGERLPRSVTAPRHAARTSAAPTRARRCRAPRGRGARRRGADRRRRRRGRSRPAGPPSRRR